MSFVTWLPSDWFGCGAYRMLCPSLALHEAGYSSRLIRPRREGDLAINGHALVIQRPLLPGIPDLIQDCRAKGRRVFYELDDDVFHVPTHNPAWRAWSAPGVAAYTAHLLQLVDHVIVSTEPLQQVVHDVAKVPLDRITVCKNHLRPEIWKAPLAAMEPVDNEGRIVIGWHGSSTHERDFSAALVALTQIVKAFPEVHLRFFGDPPSLLRYTLPPGRMSWMAGVQFSQFPGRLKYVNFDIGIAPLAQNLFNECKSGLKYLEYAAVGIPTVASDLAPYQIIQPGKTGFLCRTAHEWFDALKLLVQDETTRQLMGRAAYEDAWRHWGPGRGLAWVTLFDELVGVRRQGAA